jgi:hypothetical protein
MLEQMKKRVAELKKSNEQLTAQFNANLGAIYEFEVMIKEEEERLAPKEVNNVPSVDKFEATA